MTSALYSVIDFYLRAETINKIRSPQLYELISKAGEMKKGYYADSRIEALRAQLARRKDVVSFVDYGAKNKGKTKNVRVSQLMSTSVSNKWKCKFLRNLVLYQQPKHLIEFGTNLGVSTAYLRSARKEAKLITVDAAKQLRHIAEANFKILRYEADFKTMTFDRFLVQHYNEIETCDFFYLDGDHSYEGTLKYFETFWKIGPEQMLFVLDDINWSVGMQRAWKEIKAYSPCHSVDFYKMGIVIKRPDIQTSLHKKIVPSWLKPWQFKFFNL